MKLRPILWALSAGILLMACETQNTAWKETSNDPEIVHRSMKKLTDVIVHDIFSPPVASRVYAYPSIAAYEVIQHMDPSYQSMANQLNQLLAPPPPEAGKDYCYPLASIQAFLQVGKALIFSEEKITSFQEELLAEFEAMGVPRSVMNRSIAYGDTVAQHILDYSKTDNYKETRTYPKYTIPKDPAKWKPTPPDYMDGIEPHWREIRPFVLDSAQQFSPPPPTAFNLDKESTFMKETMEVYHALQVEGEEKEERIEIARFWDCNPYVSNHAGHVMFATKKITPGGHWIGISEIACKQADASFLESVHTYARVSIALADAFISCWDEKYRSNLIRPETVINIYIDEEWRPTLQTPPFPEHTSGHSVISRSAAITLTELFGDNFAFVDTVEEEYGLPVRSFSSFLQASEEAAVSRLYGGIHYRPAIDYGVAQGEKVGKFINSRLQTHTQQLGQR
ncbi:MAG: vanadium-dependent haloperoxidase [Bacteroidota bacterium]